MNDVTPEPVPVAPEDEPKEIFASATGVVVPDEPDAADSAESEAMRDADVANGEGAD